MEAEDEEANLAYDYEQGRMSAACFHAMAYFIVYVSPVLIVVGVVGNHPTMAIFLRNRNTRASAARIYFVVMSVVGTVEIVLRLIPNWVLFAFEVWFSPVDCRWAHFSSFMFYSVSSLGTSLLCPSSDLMALRWPRTSGCSHHFRSLKATIATSVIMKSYRRLPICTHSR